MVPVNAGEYYKKNIDKEKEYVRIAVAREVKKGENVFIDSGYGFEQETAPADGYEVKYPNFGTQAFVPKAKAIPADELEWAVPRKNLTAEGLKLIKPVKMGDEINLDHDIDSITFAESDGFIVASQDGKNPVFMSHFELTACFNDAGRKCETEKEIVIADKGKAPVKGIILTEDTLFDFKSSKCLAPAGSFLYPNPDDEDGYTVDDWIKTPNTVLRLSPDWTAREAQKAQHDAVTAKQGKLKKFTLPKKPA